MAEKTYTRRWYHGVIDGKPHYEDVELTQAEIDGLEKQRNMRLAQETNPSVFTKEVETAPLEKGSKKRQKPNANSEEPLTNG